jgi:lipid-A-disaccharide synthase
MLVIFPFEEQFYREQGVEAEFVGHPLADLPLPTVGREQFARENDIDASSCWIGLLPGSRAKEIRDNLSEMLAAAQILFLRAPKATNFCRSLEFLLPLAPTLKTAQRKMVQELLNEHGQGLSVRLVTDARAALLHARASIVASGTATVEAALIGNPFVVVYRVSPVTYQIAKRVVDVPFVAMANLIAGKLVVPELIQSTFTAANIVQQIEPLLPDGAPRESMMKELARIRGLLNPRQAGPGERPGNAISRVATITLEQLSSSLPVHESVQT